MVILIVATQGGLAMFFALLDDAFLQLIEVAKYLLNPGQRIFFLYLLSAIILALSVYLKCWRQNTHGKLTIVGFIKFLFPKKVWQHPSAWLDVRYFFFDQTLRLLIYGGFFATLETLAFHGSSQCFSAIVGQTIPFNMMTKSALWLFLISSIYMLFTIALADFVSFGFHYAQHKIPFLWEFHKVHHSAEVMHPLSSYREHPMDMILYTIGTGATFGTSFGLATALLGYVPNMPQIWGVVSIHFAFYFLGYNLRHSHIWLRWPGSWGRIFGSPAHHHIHHSFHPDHINKNFSFIFPWWDSLFGTFYLPENNENVKFGISENHQAEYSSCLGMYFIPCINVFKLLLAFSRINAKKQIERHGDVT